MISTSPHVFIESVEDVTETASIKPLPPNENNSLNPTNTALIATPIKIILRGLSPDFQDRVKTRKNARAPPRKANNGARSEEHTSELQSRGHLVCRLLLEKKKRQT